LPFESIQPATCEVPCEVLVFADEVLKALEVKLFGGDDV
jgi:hypothetical protein